MGSTTTAIAGLAARGGVHVTGTRQGKEAEEKFQKAAGEDFTDWVLTITQPFTRSRQEKCLIRYYAKKEGPELNALMASLYSIPQEINGVVYRGDPRRLATGRADG